MTFRSRLAVATFYAGLLMSAGIILAAAGAMFHHGLHSTAVFWLVGWAAIIGFLAGCAEMARRERGEAA